MLQPLPHATFSLRKDSRNKTTNECAVYIQYCINRRTVRFDTGITCAAKFWDKTNRRLTRKHQNYKELNARLRQIKAEYDKKLVAANQTEPWTMERVREIISPKKVVEKSREETDFVFLVTSTMEKEFKIGRIGISVLDNAKCSLNIFSKFVKKHLGKDAIAPSEITEALIDDYIVWRKEERGNTNETINKTLTPIYKGIKAALVKGYISFQAASLIQSKYLEPEKQKVSDVNPKEEVRYLTREQMQGLLTLYSEVKYPRTRDYLDMFLFSKVLR